MPRLPVLTPTKVIRALEKAGFLYIRQRGSHRLYRRLDICITIPFHNTDMRKGTLRHIIKQSNISLKEFLDLL